MIAEENNELLPLAERLRILEEKWLIEPEKMELERNPSPLPLPQCSIVQTMLQEDRNSDCCL